MQEIGNTLARGPRYILNITYYSTLPWATLELIPHHTSFLKISFKYLIYYFYKFDFFIYTVLYLTICKEVFFQTLLLSVFKKFISMQFINIKTYII